MTNAEKYKTAEERAEAFKVFCKKHEGDGCKNCPANGYDYGCWFHWLDLEAPEEKPLPCPFCGCHVNIIWDDGEWCNCHCDDCEYTAKGGPNAAIAIARHNRVARAVMAAKEVAK